MTRLGGELSAAQVVALLRLKPHPEGGHYLETYREPPAGHGKRGACTAIYYLLEADQVSHWHRVDAVEIWHWHAGGPLVLSVSPDGEACETIHLGPALDLGQRPQAAVARNAWRSALSLGAWTLVGCTFAPAFSDEGFELAPPGWRPGRHG